MDLLGDHGEQTSGGVFANEDGVIETLGHVWRSEFEGMHAADSEGQERRLYQSEYDVEVVRGCNRVRDGLERLKERYGNSLAIPDAAVTLLDGGVCKTQARTRRTRIHRVRSKIYEFVKEDSGWERAAENVVRFVGAGDQSGPLEDQ